MRLVSTVLAILVTLTLAGCGASGGSDSGGSSGDGPQRVASLGLGDVDTLLSLGVTPVLVAPWAQDAKEPVGEWSKPLLNGQNPEMLLGTGNGVDTKAMEKIAASRPDVIVAVNSGFDEETFTKLESIAPVVRRPAEFAAWGVPWEKQVQAIAAGVDKSPQGDELIAKTNARIKQAQADHPQYRGKTAASVLPMSDGGVYVYSATDGRGQVLTMLGFSLPETLSSRVPGGQFYATISAENLPLIDLDALIYLDYGTKPSDDTAFRALKVTTENRVATVDRSLGNAMSMPNPVTLDWVLTKLPPLLPTFA